MDPKHKQGIAYDNEDERRKGYLAAQNRHASKSWICSYCNVTIRKGNRSNHLKSKKHCFNLTSNNYIYLNQNEN